MNSRKKINKNSKRYIQWFGIVVIVLALVRCVFLGESVSPGFQDCQDVVAADAVDSLEDSSFRADAKVQTPTDSPVPSVSKTIDWSKSHRIRGVASFDKAFPDSNHVQLLSAKQWGVSPVKDREDAERRKCELVYIGSSPYYIIKPLTSSIPYLVPHAALLLEDIGRNFMDSLQVKGLPLHYIVVTSVLRSEYDVKRLRRHNGNATEQSCHLYGTTFDVNYNLYAKVTDPTECPKPDYGEARYKQVLSEVLNDLRQQGRCYVKYERKQPCFHITVR